jgi:hypothetical protein
MVASAKAHNHQAVVRWEGKKIPTTATCAAQKYLAAFPRYGHLRFPSYDWRRF